MNNCAQSAVIHKFHHFIGSIELLNFLEVESEWAIDEVVYGTGRQVFPATISAVAVEDLHYPVVFVNFDFCGFGGIYVETDVLDACVGLRE